MACSAGGRGSGRACRRRSSRILSVVYRRGSTTRPAVPQMEEGTMTEGSSKLLGAALGAAFAIALVPAASAQETIKIGLLATLEGPFAAGGQDGMRGAELAVKQR